MRKIVSQVIEMHFSNTSTYVRMAFLNVKHQEKNRGKDKMPARELPGFGKKEKKRAKELLHVTRAS